MKMDDTECGNRKKKGCYKMVKNVKFFKFLTNIGLCMVLLLAVKTFHESIPDHIYVEVGETLSYDLLVPVTVERKED